MVKWDRQFCTQSFPLAGPRCSPRRDQTPNLYRVLLLRSFRQQLSWFISNRNDSGYYCTLDTQGGTKKAAFKDQARCTSDSHRHLCLCAAELRPGQSPGRLNVTKHYIVNTTGNKTNSENVLPSHPSVLLHPVSVSGTTSCCNRCLVSCLAVSARVLILDLP